MTSVRPTDQQYAFLVSTLERLIAGGSIDDGYLEAGIADSDAKSLTGAALKAYYGLSYWSDDADVRAKVPSYGPMQRAVLSGLLDRLVRERGQA